MNVAQKHIFKTVIYETIQEVGSAPSGHIYAAVMAYLSLDDYQAIMDELVQAKKVTHSGHVYTLVSK